MFQLGDVPTLSPFSLPTMNLPEYLAVANKVKQAEESLKRVQAKLEAAKAEREQAFNDLEMSPEDKAALKQLLDNSPSSALEKPNGEANNGRAERTTLSKENKARLKELIAAIVQRNPTGIAMGDIQSQLLEGDAKPDFRINEAFIQKFVYELAKEKRLTKIGERKDTKYKAAKGK